MVGLVITGLVVFVISAVIGMLLAYRMKQTSGRIWQIHSLKFVGEQLDGAKDARTELRKADLAAREAKKNLDILDYVGSDPVKTQVMLQLVYAFNRIGAAMQKGILNQQIIFATWQKKWFADNWKIFASLIEKERERRKIPDLYSSFEWLGKECSK